MNTRIQRPHGPAITGKGKPRRLLASERAPAGTMTLRLSEIMGRHRITQSALAEASGLLPATIHQLYHERTTSISFEALARVLAGLQHLTGRPYHAGDLLHFEPATS